MMTLKKKQVFQIIQDVAKQKTKAKKIEVLRANDIMPLRDVLQGTFDEAIQWNLPEGTPPFKESEDDSHPTTLLKEHLKFKYFVKGLQESSRLPAVKREKMFIDMLESVHPGDAQILIDMINKKAPKGITKSVVKEAFPDLIS